MTEPAMDRADSSDENSEDIYNADAIQVLKGLEGVRKRPAMYIGDTGVNGLHELIKEIVNNSVDEAMADRCSRIDVIMKKDGSVRIQDDGHGIPTDFHPGENKSGVEVVMTMLHAGGKFDRSDLVELSSFENVRRCRKWPDTRERLKPIRN